MATQTYLLVFSKPVHVLDWKDGALLVKWDISLLSLILRWLYRMYDQDESLMIPKTSASVYQFSRRKLRATAPL